MDIEDRNGYIRRGAERNELPGCPSTARLKAVRRFLKSYGIVPARDSAEWRLAWKWAAQIADSYMFRKCWPANREIAAQYILLVLAKIRDEGGLKLPFRAREQAPTAVLERLGQAARLQDGSAMVAGLLDNIQGEEMNHG